MSVGLAIVGQPYIDYGPDLVGQPLPRHFTVRVFGHAGLQRIPQVLQPQLSGGTTEQVAQPYLWAQKVIVLSNPAPAAGMGLAIIGQPYIDYGPSPISGPFVYAIGSTTKVPSDPATMVIIEIPDGRAIRVEFNSPQRPSPVMAGNKSKVLTGFNLFSWMPGTTLSMIDATVYP